MLSYKDAKARRIVRLPSGEQAVLLFVGRDGGSVRAQVLGTGRRWKGSQAKLTPTDLYMHRDILCQNDDNPAVDDGKKFKKTA